MVHILDRSLFSILKWRLFPDWCLLNLHNNENDVFLLCILYGILRFEIQTSDKYVCWNAETSYFCSAAERLEKNLTFLFKWIEVLHSHEPSYFSHDKQLNIVHKKFFAMNPNATSYSNTYVYHTGAQLRFVGTLSRNIDCPFSLI